MWHRGTWPQAIAQTSGDLIINKSYASFFIDFFKGCNTFSQHEWTNFHNIANKSLSNMQIYKFTSSHPPQQAMLSRMNDVKKDVEEHT